VGALTPLLAFLYVVEALGLRARWIGPAIRSSLPTFARPEVCAKCLQVSAASDNGPAGSDKCADQGGDRSAWTIEGIKLLSVAGLVYNSYRVRSAAAHCEVVGLSSDVVHGGWWSLLYLQGLAWSAVLGCHLQSICFRRSLPLQDCKSARHSISIMMLLGIVSCFGAMRELYLASHASHAYGHSCAARLQSLGDILFEALCSMALALASAATAPVTTCLDPTSPNYVIDKASPLSQMFLWWYPSFADQLSRQNIGPGEFPVPPTKCGLKGYEATFRRHPLLLSSNIAFAWSLMRPFLWHHAMDMVSSVVEIALSLADPYTINRLLTRIEEESDPRVIVPEIIWFLLLTLVRDTMGVIIRNKISDAVNALEEKRRAALNALLEDIKLQEKCFKVAAPILFEPEDDDDLSSLSFVQRWTVRLRIRKRKQRDINGERLIRKLYAVHAGHVEWNDVVSFPQKLLRIATMRIDSVCSLLVLYTFVGWGALVPFACMFISLFWTWIKEALVDPFEDQQELLQQKLGWLNKEAINNIRI
ncbi:hypothetical protein EV182_003983, partial [Spiromyces aspiralis]